MFTARSYQATAEEKAIEYFESKSKKRPLIISPTGSGKSIIIAFITKRLIKDVLILQPTIELLHQNYEKFIMCGGNASIYSAGAGSKEIGDVTFATIGSVVNVPELFEHKKHIIVDECHRVPPKKDSMYMRFFAKINVKKYLGLTATAFRNKTAFCPITEEAYTKLNLLTRERPKFFNQILHVSQISEMYDMGFLAPIKWLQLEWSGELLKNNSTGAEYTDESIKESVDYNRIKERLPNIVKDALSKGRKHILVFVKSVDTAEALAKITPRSACVSARNNKKERALILNQFKNGDIDVVYNVSVLTTGFDFPALDTVILARPTRSLELYMQMVGRGIRLHESKEYCVVLDMCSNYKRFGKIEDMEYVNDIDPAFQYGLKTNWILRNKERILSGVKLDF
ncbi:MAG: DEAD/DEAH box helicase [Candidatus Peribacteraceae bacterium]|nr:DEAD/DEAH box helicase [Candidatus Peribacteraceae bacterium]